jgi:L-amino acid N-acyltransferase YncA
MTADCSDHEFEEHGNRVPWLQERCSRLTLLRRALRTFGRLAEVEQLARRSEAKEGGTFSIPMKIRPATEADHDAIWEMFHAIIEAGDVFAFDRRMSRGDSLAFWSGTGKWTYVVEQDGGVAGSYYLTANQGGGGAHVANAGFMVSSSARGQHLGRAMCEHCLQEARRLGFHAMQFNFVVSTNESAVHLWKEFGFEIIGTLPGAFRHPQKGYVDVYVMYRSLL